jgi:small subunit ribosomal protein S8
MSDSISDYLTIIRNAYKARMEFCDGKFSKMHLAIAGILKDEGYIRDAEVLKNEKGAQIIRLKLKYVDENPAITGIQRQSKPGCRQYYSHDEIPRTLSGLGIGILTTPKGVLKDREARRIKVGGEMVCTVW